MQLDLSRQKLRYWWVLYLPVLFNYIFSIHKAGHVFAGKCSKVNQSNFWIFVWVWFSESGADAIRLIQTLEEVLVPASRARFGMDPVAVLFHRSPGFDLQAHKHKGGYKRLMMVSFGSQEEKKNIFVRDSTWWQRAEMKIKFVRRRI